MKTRILPNPPSMLVVLNTVAFKTPSMTPSSKSSGSSRLTASHIEIFSLCFWTSHHFYCMPLEMSHIYAILEWPEHSWEMYITILQRKHTADYKVISQMIPDFMSLWEGRRSRNLTWNTGWSYISHPINPKPFHQISLHLQIRNPVPCSCHCHSSHPKQELTLFTPTLHCYVSSVFYPMLPCFHVCNIPLCLNITTLSSSGFLTPSEFLQKL